jgi:multiple sugar transport system permease protein
VIVSLVIGIPRPTPPAVEVPGSEDLMFQMLSFRFAPELMVIVPLFVIYNQIGLFDTKVGHDLGAAAGHDAVGGVDPAVVLPGPARGLEQAALLDGYTRSRAFVMVALPLVRPGIAAAALLAFIFAWNNYVFPLILPTPARHRSPSRSRSSSEAGGRRTTT